MTNDLDTVQDSPEEPPDVGPDLDCITVENDGAPDECAIFPREASEPELLDTWISAQGEAFVDLESIQ